MQYNVDMEGNLYEMYSYKKPFFVLNLLAFFGLIAGIVLIYAAAVILS